MEREPAPLSELKPKLSEEDILLYGRALKKLCDDDADSINLAVSIFECQETKDLAQVLRILANFPHLAFDDRED